MNKLNTHGTKIIVGKIYQHISGRDHIYKVLAVYDDATDFEKTQKITKKTIVYEQLYEGSFPMGTLWTRNIDDFKKNFTLIENRKEN